MKDNIAAILLVIVVACTLVAVYVCPTWWYYTMETTVYFKFPEGSVKEEKIAIGKCIMLGCPDGEYPLFVERWHGRSDSSIDCPDGWPCYDESERIYPDYGYYMVVKTRIKDEGIKQRIISNWLNQTELDYRIGSD